MRVRINKIPYLNTTLPQAPRTGLDILKAACILKYLHWCCKTHTEMIWKQTEVWNWWRGTGNRG